MLRARASRTSASALTWLEAWSSDAASLRTSPSGTTPVMRMETTPACPLVRVPVLSRTAVRILASDSSAPPLLTSTPREAARDRPEMIATGTARMSGQGVATTRTASALVPSPLAHHAPPAIASVSSRKPYGIAIGKSHHRCAALLGALHEPHDTGIGALVRAPQDLDIEGAADHRAAACHFVPPGEPDGKRLPRQRRHVDIRPLG